MKDFPNEFDLERHDAQVREQAFKAFRARKRLGRTRAAMSFLLVLAAMIVLARRPAKENSQLAPPPLASRDSIPAQSSEPLPPPAKIHILSDEELLAMFPEDSCYLAEVNGRKRLVFVDPKLAKEFIY